MFCPDKHVFVETRDFFATSILFFTTKDVYSCDKHVFFTTKERLSRIVFVPTKVLLRQAYFVATEIRVLIATNTCLLRQHLSRQK